MKRHWTTLFLLFTAIGLGASPASEYGAVVPGTGTRIDFVGDPIEDPEWEFIHNHPKSSREQDEQTRFPNGRATNGRWFEGPERGQPDLMKVVPTPAGGLPDSQFALLMRTLHSGVPGRLSFEVQQDDLIVDGVSRIGAIPVAEIPSIVTRVYLPPAEEWENRTGPHFGFRGTASTTIMKTEEKSQQRFGRLRSFRPQTYQAKEQYWPGIWVHFRSETDSNVQQDSAFLTVRGNRLGHDFNVKEIAADEFGWWTFGMSFTADGRVHYYAKQGVDELTEADHLTSQLPYSYAAEIMENMFFNICNYDDGKTWSTPFVIDDPRLYVVKSERIARIVENKEQATARREQQRQAKITRGSVHRPADSDRGR